MCAFQKFLRFLSLLLLFSLFAYNVSIREEEEEDAAHVGKDARKFNFASVTSGAELIDYSPKSGKGFKYLLSDDRDKYSLFNCNEKKWVILGLSEDVQIESIALASFERYSSIIKDFQVLAAVSFPQSNWIDLGNYTVEPRLGEQLFTIQTPPSHHTRFVKLRFFTHHFNEDICTLSQIKVFGKTIYETLRTGVDNLFLPGEQLLSESSSEINDSSIIAGNGTENQSIDSAIESSKEENSSDINEKKLEELLEKVNIDPLTVGARESTVAQVTNTLEENNSFAVPEVANETAVINSMEVRLETSEGEDKSFSAEEWRLINDTLESSNVSEAFYATAIRSIRKLFSPGDSVGLQVNRNNLLTFISGLRREEKENQSCSFENNCQEAGVGPNESKEEIGTNDKEFSADLVSSEALPSESTTTSDPLSIAASTKSAANESSSSSIESYSTASVPVKEEFVLETVDVSITNEKTDTSTFPNNKPAELTATNETSIGNATTTTDSQEALISNTTTISSLLNTTSMDCLSLLKFAEYRKKRLKEEKENNGLPADDKANVFNKLFIRIKYIETNEEIIGLFFDEVVKCFQNETLSLRDSLEVMQTETKALKERMKQIEALVLEQKTLQERQRQRSLEKIREWDAFVKDAPRFLPSSSSDSKSMTEEERKEKMKLTKSSSELTTYEDDDLDKYYQDYFHQLFLTKNLSESELFRNSQKLFPSSSASAFQSGFAQYLKQLLFQTFQQVDTSSISSNQEKERVYDGLSSVWSQLYTWSHFYTSDMIFMMMVCLGILAFMMTSLTFLLIIWILTQKRS